MKNFTVEQAVYCCVKVVTVCDMLPPFNLDLGCFVYFIDPL